jgi:hypothetical protein
MATAVLQQQQQQQRLQAAHAQRADEAQEVASFLLQLKHKNAPQVPVRHPLRQLETHLPLRQAQAAQAAARLHSLPLGYPVGSVYGYPGAAAARFEQTLLERAAAAQLERAAPSLIERAPTLLEESNVSETSWEQLIDESELVLMKDRDLVPDSLFVAMAQMKPCKLTQADRVGCYKSREIGFVGMCCKHCGGQPGFGRYYPNSVRSLAQTTTSQTILKHITGKCRFCPPQVRQAVLELQRHQAAKEGMSSGRPRYGSRKIFFQRVWARLHGGKEDNEVEGEKESESEDSKQENVKAEGDAASEHESEEDSSSESPVAIAPRSATKLSKRSLPTHKRKESKDSSSSSPEPSPKKQRVSGT